MERFAERLVLKGNVSFVTVPFRFSPSGSSFGPEYFFFNMLKNDPNRKLALFGHTFGIPAERVHSDQCEYMLILPYTRDVSVVSLGANICSIK